jgi:hypothetical protein
MQERENSMIDSFLLWLFVWISKRWFNSVVFGTDPETERATSISFFEHEEHAEQYLELLKKGREEKQK